MRKRCDGRWLMGKWHCRDGAVTNERGIMKQDEVVIRTVYAMNQLMDIKRLEKMIEDERVKVARHLRLHVETVKGVRDEIARFVASESDEVKQIGDLCELIKGLDRIIEYEEVRAI